MICSFVRAHRALQNIAFTGFLLLCALVFSCSGFVQDVSRPIDLIPDDRLNSQSQVDFLIRGVQALFADSFADMALYGGGLSDELLFDARTGAGGLVIYEEVDNALRIDRANAQLIAVQNRLGRYRFHADDLVERVGKIEFSQDSLRQKALFEGNFHGAVARYFYAAYIGLNKNEGGGVLGEGAFIPSAAMYDSSLQKARRALNFARAERERRLTRTFIARVLLLQGKYAEAVAEAQNGLRATDAPLRALYSAQAQNQLWLNAGLGRNVYVPARRFDTLYLRNTPGEAARIQLQGPIARSGFTFTIQTKYPAQDSPIPFLTWQENELILAECELRGAPPQSASALNRINAVRQSYAGLSPLPPSTQPTLEILYAERDKELFLTGARLLDQRRFNRWHLGQDTWRYLPIAQPEININPNLPPLVRD